MTRRLTKRLAHDYSQVLTAIFSYMLSSGIPAGDLWLVCGRSLKRAENSARKGWEEESGGLVTAALVLDAWHRDRRYLNAKAAPKAVRLLGPAPSVEALIRVQRRRGEAARIARRLKGLRLVVPCGKSLYKPTSDVAVISRHDPLILQHVAKALSTLLETVTQNLNRSTTSTPLIERIAEVPDLPRKHIVAFQRFSRVQGWLLLRTINDWLESRRTRQRFRTGARSSVRAGVHVYAYVAPRRRHASRFTTSPARP
jgi:hypothetical protein